jgi:hypothetical protein
MMAIVQVSYGLGLKEVEKTFNKETLFTFQAGAKHGVKPPLW